MASICLQHGDALDSPSEAGVATLARLAFRSATPASRSGPCGRVLARLLVMGARAAMVIGELVCWIDVAPSGSECRHGLRLASSAEVSGPRHVRG